jgi:anti-anti-sigma factor
VEWFSDTIRDDLEQGGELVLDLTDLEFLDSSGLRAMIQAATSLQGRGRLVLESPRQAVRRLFEVSGVDKLQALEIRDESEEPPAPT